MTIQERTNVMLAPRQRVWQVRGLERAIPGEGAQVLNDRVFTPSEQLALINLQAVSGRRRIEAAECALRTRPPVRAREEPNQRFGHEHRCTPVVRVQQLNGPFRTAVIRRNA